LISKIRVGGVPKSQTPLVRRNACEVGGSEVQCRSVEHKRGDNGKRLNSPGWSAMDEPPALSGRRKAW